MTDETKRWCEAYDQWQKDCLAEYNEKFGENRTLYATPEVDYEVSDLVEFAEDGDAYPHGPGGINHIRQAVTPWEQSEHYLPTIYTT